MKKTIRLTESDLHKVIEESVRVILNESENPFKDSIYDIVQRTMEEMGYSVNGNGSEMEISTQNGDEYCSLTFF